MTSSPTSRTGSGAGGTRGGDVNKGTHHDSVTTRHDSVRTPSLEHPANNVTQEEEGSDDQWCDFLVDGEQSVRVEGPYIHYLNLHNRTVALTESFPGDVRVRYNLHTTDTVTILAEQVEKGTFGPWLVQEVQQARVARSSILQHPSLASDSPDATIIFAIQDGWVRVHTHTHTHMYVCLFESPSLQNPPPQT